MIQVFTSYRREASSMLASLIREKLKHHHIDAYVDTYDMMPGPFPTHLRSEIEASEAFLCLLADNTLDSDWVNKEIEHAYNQKKVLIPVFQEDYKPPVVKPEYVDALLSSNGITILDKRNLYVDEAIAKIAEFVKSVNQQLRTKRVRVQITLDLPRIDIPRFLVFLSGVTLIGVNLIQLISQHIGSVILTLEMPEEAADRLIKLTQEDPELFAEYRIQNIEYVGLESNRESIVLRELVPPEIPQTPKQNVFFSAYAPKEISPDKWQPFYAYIYKEALANVVLADAMEKLAEDASKYRSTKQIGNIQSPAEGALITATPFVNGLNFNPPSMTINFFEDWHRLEFRVIPKEAPLSQAATGTLTFTIEGIIVADIHIAVFVEDADLNKISVSTTSASLYQKIFASYSHRDHVIVKRIEAAYRALGMDYLRDVTSIRSGERWSDRLLELIDDADIFQLFWSRAAAKDKYVKHEWMYGLRYEKQRESFIRPVFWQHPIPQPPPELAHLNFKYIPGLTSA